MMKMTKIFTIGSNGKTCKSFFEILKTNNIELVIDIRLNNKSQLAGFSKGGDEYLGYLLKEISKTKYIHDSFLAPTGEILDNYHENHGWNEYVSSFNELMKKRDIKSYFWNRYSSYSNICLLCSEESPIKCHRRLIAEFVSKDKGMITHL